MKIPWIHHDSHQSFYRTPFGAVTCQHRVSFGLSVEDGEEEIYQVALRLWTDQEGEKLLSMRLVESINNQQIYRLVFDLPSYPCLVWYYFIITTNTSTYYYGNNPHQQGGIGQVYLYQPPAYQITVHKENSLVPSWFKSSVMYQIFVDRFFNGSEDGRIMNPKPGAYLYSDWNATPSYIRDQKTGAIVQYDFFGGNLAGVIKKLPYLQSLGINLIYLNPIFESSSNHKYDTADYKKIDPMYGDHEAFQSLCEEAEKLGISIILDGVFSHTGSDSIYFNKNGNYPGLGAYQSTVSPYYPWYRFEVYPDQYDCWWGIDTMPNTNETEPTFQGFIIHDEDSVLQHWMDSGAKGWRLDVADELPGSFIKALRKRMKEIYPESILIGEVWEDASHKISHGESREYLLGEELDSIMNYPFRHILLDFILGHFNSKEVHQAFMCLYENYPRHHFYATMNLIGSHDVPRILTLLGDAPPESSLSKEEQGLYRLSPEQKKKALKRLTLLSLVQMTFPGVPCIYYGDEAGVEGYSDPLNRRTYPWGREDQVLLTWYRKIIEIRRQYDALSTGDWISLPIHEDIYGYMRCIECQRDIFGENKKNNRIFVFINRSLHQEIPLTIDVASFGDQPWMDILHDSHEFSVLDSKLNISLKPLEGKIIVQKL
ncbi:4-alpha-glucanotransferase [Anaerosolibacter carboniphilus]|uniref:4-alpha-glucanotransferase n=1 Tax=Anaerosolibacter carboniphilus TaxID=1417629 RepID=A0A841KQM6_9FIRM|nr:glycoside hydrolase family 13 protein [Anaerosolibacter carboniphilus]MBB6215786.1 4-alpha-glucanotransferase [Anaerosolibacter carboniphilus]